MRTNAIKATIVEATTDIPIGINSNMLRPCPLALTMTYPMMVISGSATWINCWRPPASVAGGEGIVTSP